jgi:hypothetical protein
MATPNRYQLSGGGIVVNYTTTSLTGDPQFQYHHGTVAKSFVGASEIQAIETQLGTVVSVTILLTVDSGSTSFSVLIPRINLAPDQRSAVNTEGITTTHHFSLIPAFEHGQLDAYSVTPMKGTANIVVF